MIKRRIRIGIAVMVVVPLLYVALVSALRNESRCRLPNGVAVRVKHDSLWNSVPSGKCEIEVSTDSGKQTSIVLYQDLFDAPIIAVPGATPNILFCVYDYDTDFQLLKINLNSPFQTSQTGGFVKSNVITSTCQIERVSTTDTNSWRLVSQLLREMPPEDYGKQARKNPLLPSSTYCPQQELANIVHDYGRQGLYADGF